jgi:hypothetical protein
MPNVPTEFLPVASVAVTCQFSQCKKGSRNWIVPEQKTPTSDFASPPAATIQPMFRRGKVNALGNSFPD